MKCLEHHLHSLETGDTITLREVKGMEAINGTVHTVTGTACSGTTGGQTGDGPALIIAGYFVLN